MIKDKLHLGCGRCYLPPEQGWLNVDYFSNTKADAYHDITNLPFEKETFALAYISHVAEHLHRFSIDATFNHWVSLLKRGGVMRIAVPDFRSVCEYYMETGKLEDVIGLCYGRQDSSLNRHTIAFDQRTLTGYMERAGLRDIRRWDWRLTEHAQYDDYASSYLPHLDKTTGRLMSLNLEGIKS